MSLPGTSDPGDDEPEVAQLEAEIWLQCPNSTELDKLGQMLSEKFDGPGVERVAPEPHRRFMILQYLRTPDGREPWADCFAYGLDQGSLIQQQATEAGIDTVVYAVRVGPVDGDYEQDRQEAKRSVASH